VEKAAESVLGDDVEALRLARRELETLSQQLEKEIAQGDTNRVSTNLLASGGRFTRRGDAGEPRPASTGTDESADSQNGANAQENSGQRSGQERGEREQASNQQPGSQAQPGRNGTAQNARSQEGNAENPGQQQSASAQQPNDSPGSQGQSGNSAGQRAGRDRARQSGQRAPSLASDSPNNQSGGGGGRGGNGRQNFFDGGARTGGFEGGGVYRPLTGDDFVDWSDRLRDVEEMVDLPEVRNEVARIRDRARVLRMDLRREGKKPDWAVVRLQISGPLVEVRDRVAEELARRESKDALVPIDRDPVPPQFSELVRRYYEQLGKSE
jgi:hypothetical protein